MPIAVTEAIESSVRFEAPRKRWTRQEFAAVEEAGLLAGQRLELIEGDLITKMPKNRRHTNGLIFLQAWLIQTFGLEFINPETSIDVAPEENPTSEPEPDLIVLQRPSWEYADANPSPSDIRLVVEVADSTLSFDLRNKATLYARAGIAEYWVLDVAMRRLIVHREPGAGHYAAVAAYSESESVAPLAAPTMMFRVADAFRSQ